MAAATSDAVALPLHLSGAATRCGIAASVAHRALTLAVALPVGRVTAAWLARVNCWSCPTGARSASRRGAGRDAQPPGGGLAAWWSPWGPGRSATRPCGSPPASAADDAEAAERGLFDGGGGGAGFRVRPVMIDPADYRAYYDVVANQTLWFCLHGLWDLPRRPRFDRHWWAAWERFQRVNEQFAAAASDAAAHGATVLVQDYQLALVPGLLAERRPDLRTAAFVHTPWCSPQELAVLPDAVATDILAGLAGGGACGFHSARWADAFSAVLPGTPGAGPDAFVSPAATDVDDMRAVAASDECARELGPPRVGRRRPPADRAGRPHRAVQERAAGLLGLRRAARRLARTCAGGWSSRPWSTRPGWVWPSTWPTDRRSGRWPPRSTPSGGTSRWRPILLDPSDDYPGSVAALRRSDVAARQPGPGRPQSGGQGGPAGQRAGRGPGPEPPGRGLGRARAATPSASTPSMSPARRRRSAPALDLPAAERAARSRALRKVINARSPLDWFDELPRRGPDALTRVSRPARGAG